jgi:hypothetical protein
VDLNKNDIPHCMDGKMGFPFKISLKSIQCGQVIGPENDV